MVGSRLKTGIVGMIAGLAASFSIAATAVAQDGAPSGTYVLDRTHASIIWKVSHLGLSNYAGRFASFDATLSYDADNPEASSVTVEINPLSVRTDYPFPEKTDFDAKLGKGEDWFNAGAFPVITFTSTKLEQTGPTTGKMTGDLTMLGVTKPVTLDVTMNGSLAEHPMNKKPAIGFSATGEIKRSDWGFSTYVPMIGDTVTLQIEAEFNAQ